jgi:hypothetical protein
MVAKPHVAAIPQCDGLNTHVQKVLAEYVPSSYDSTNGAKSPTERKLVAN